ncbi:MAG: nitrile hydratase subunit beta [Chloroflexi bacterium]|nr:nitrile hydratase subunit beta [Chloroflexota bacterium]
MNGVHDMGGMHGFGPIDIEADEPVFHDEWEGRVYGIVTGIREERDVYGPYGSRHYIENIPPAQYLAASYYERWMLALEAALISKGLLTADELDAKTRDFAAAPSAAPSRRDNPALAERVRQRIYAPQPIEEQASSLPRFAISDAVVVRNIHPVGHTRLPRYVRGKRGIVERVYGAQGFQDEPTIADRSPQHVYSVSFDAVELWGANAEPNQRLYIDMWESWMEAAE